MTEIKDRILSDQIIWKVTRVGLNELEVSMNMQSADGWHIESTDLYEVQGAHHVLIIAWKFKEANHGTETPTKTEEVQGVQSHRGTKKKSR